MQTDFVSFTHFTLLLFFLVIVVVVRSIALIALVRSRHLYIYNIEIFQVSKNWLITCLNRHLDHHHHDHEQKVNNKEKNDLIIWFI